MKAGNFNINDYLEKLYEESTQMMSGGEGLTDADGIVIPDTNKKSYDWLKKEFQKGKVEVKVEMNMGGSKFEPGYDLQTDLDSVKDFKPGMFGEVKTAGGKPGEKEDGAPGEKEPEKKGNLDPKKESPNFSKGEGEKGPAAKTDGKPGDIKDKGKAPEDKAHEKHEAGESKEKEAKEEHEAGESEEKEEKEEKKAAPGDTKVKKLDLKTKK